MTPDIQARLREILAAVKTTHAAWFTGDSSKTRKAYGNATDEMEIFLMENAQSFLDEISRLTSDLADLKHDMERLMESTTAEATENERLRGKLEWYGDRENWEKKLRKVRDHSGLVLRNMPGPALGDKGQRAREALKQ